MNPAREPRSHRDRREVQRKISLLRAPHVSPLTEYVERLRFARGGGEAVPWFDPTEAGITARILLLLEAPGPRAIGAGGPRPAAAGSGFISPPRGRAFVLASSQVRHDGKPTARIRFNLKLSVRSAAVAPSG